MLPIITFLDLETTGATPLTDRITEIGLVRFEHGIEVCRWQTLVNPETTIPPFIQNLTGITNEMVQDAPTFAQIADELAAYLEGAVMAAHNARFDLGFLKSEYRRIGQTLKQKVLCTVKLSRQLYPQYPKHSLNAIMERHQLTTQMRHRAMGDVELMIGFINAAQQALGPAKLQAAAQQLIKQASVPIGIDPTLLEDLPDTCGVYLFYGENDCLLYVGKSINIRERVYSHFSSDHASTKEMRLSQELKRIDWIETAGELGALLLESRLVKDRQPIYNRQLRRQRQLCAWQINPDPNATPLVKLIYQDEITPNSMSELFGTFKTKKQATDTLRNIATEQKLCQKLLGLETGTGPCFAAQLKRCNGACCGKEDKTIHQLKLQQALAKHRLKAWPYQTKIGIKEHNPITNQTQIHLFDQWCHLGTVNNENDLAELMQTKTVFAFDLDSYKLILKILNQGKHTLIKMS